MTDNDSTHIGYSLPDYATPADGAEPFELHTEHAEATASVEQQLADNQLPTEAITAFTVLLSKGGWWVGTSKVELASCISLEREANLTDMVAGSGAVMADAAAARSTSQLAQILSQMPSVTASMVVEAQAAQVRKMQEEATARQTLRAATGGRGIEGLRSR